MAGKRLSATQERRLADYLDDQFLEVTRAYKKRSHPSTALPTLSSYLKATHLILDLVLQIPPVDPSTSLRTTFLLRLTGEIMTSIPGYPPTLETLPELLDWMGDLDRGWLAVLRSQLWDPETQSGISISLSGNDRSSPASQTERARLRSLIISGTEMLAEWLETLDKDRETTEDEQSDVETRLDELFTGTLQEMGVLQGEVIES